MDKKNIKAMNSLLATTAVFNQKVMNLHWHIKGESFMIFHKMTETVYEALFAFIDEIAEKILMEGGKAHGTLEQYLKGSKIKEVKEKDFKPQFVVKTIIKDLEILEAEALKVEGTHTIQPLLDEIFMFISKQKWLFESSLA